MPIINRKWHSKSYLFWRGIKEKEHKRRFSKKQQPNSSVWGWNIKPWEHLVSKSIKIGIWDQTSWRDIGSTTAMMNQKRPTTKNSKTNSSLWPYVPKSSIYAWTKTPQIPINSSYWMTGAELRSSIKIIKSKLEIIWTWNKFQWICINHFKLINHL